MRVSDVAVCLVELPQRAPIAPYRSWIRESSSTRKILVRLETETGLCGWGEANANFVEDLDSRRMQRDAAAWLCGRDPTNLNAFHAQCPFEPRLKSALEMACWDVFGRACGLPVAVLLGGVIRTHVEVAACMGIQPLDRIAPIVQRYVEEGFRVVKLKAGADLDHDVATVATIREAVGARLAIRVDPNRAYTPQQAQLLARRLEPYDLEYLEQPIPAEPLSDACQLRAATSIPIALNESVTDPASVLAILREDAADVVLPDTHIAGGIWPCVQIGCLASAAGIPCVMHCGHDLGLKTAAMVHIAAAVPAYSRANDTTYYGLADDILVEPLVIERGRIAVPTGPGLGVEVDESKLARYRID